MFSAAQNFEKRLRLLMKMISFDASLDTSLGITKRGQEKLVEGIRASLAVLPVAFFEEFLRSLITQYIDVINNKMPRLNWESLPEKLRRTHTIDTPLIIRSKKFPGESYSAYEMRMFGEIEDAFRKVISPKISPNAYVVAAHVFTQTNNNPDAETINDMFNRLGFKDIFRKPALVRKMEVLEAALNSGDAIRLRLDSIVQRRHAVAHGRTPGSLVRQDLERDINFLFKLSVGLQMVARSESKRLLR